MFFNKKRLTKQLIIDDILLRESIAQTADECEALEFLSSQGFRRYDVADLRVIAGMAFEELFFSEAPSDQTFLHPDEYSLSKDEKHTLMRQRERDFTMGKINKIPCWLRDGYDESA